MKTNLPVLLVFLVFCPTASAFPISFFPGIDTYLERYDDIVIAECAAVANKADEFPNALAAPNADWVYFRYLPTKEQMDAVHRAGKRSFIAGANVAGNVPENWRHCTEVGLDAVLTDYPLDLRQVLKGKQ